MHFSVSKNCWLSILSGLCLGLSAPGIGFWPIAWFGLAPLLILIRLRQSLFQATLYGFLFGLAFNCIYLHWYLGLAPLDWLGFNAWQGQILAISALLIVAGHQAFLIAIFSLVYRLAINLLEKFATISEMQINSIIKIVLAPILWIICTNKFGNAHDLMGVPWSMLEYTQYQQLPLIQIADIIGGIGICFLIVLVNALLAEFVCIAKISGNSTQFPLHLRLPRSTNFKGAWIKISPALSMLAIFFLISLVYGRYKLSQIENDGGTPIAIVQPNINIEMEKSKRDYSIDKLLTYQLRLSNFCPPGICVWTEGSLPVRLNNDRYFQSVLKYFAEKKQLDLIIGTIDEDKDEVYNAAWSTSHTGDISEHAYHKRYLVPFGEYTPGFVRNWPEWILRLTNTPAGSSYSSGRDPAVLNVSGKLIAPLICFEIISPELAAASIRAGGELFINMNDLAWFHKSVIGEQMIAAAVLRAIENRRDLIFAANTGPSAIISSTGKIKFSTGQDKACILINNVNFSSELSVFTRWFMF